MKKNNVHTPSSAAEILGITPQYVRTLIVQYELGQQVTHGRYLLYPSDMATLQRILRDAPRRRPRISTRG